jgi:hypothetical protein
MLCGLFLVEVLEAALNPFPIVFAFLLKVALALAPPESPEEGKTITPNATPANSSM